MRDMSASMAKKIASHIQAGDSALSANVWVSRPTTQLVDDVFLEKQRIPFGTNVTKTSVAACHPRLMRDATEVYVGYIDGGTAKIAKAVYNYQMENHEWVDTGFSEPAEDISLCFNGTMPKNTRGMVEFKTEEKPWVFWMSAGALYARKLGSDTTVTLAEANCRAVSAVRAMWSEIGNFDFGLIAFFILGGYLYYRQYIDGEWYDGELVSANPTGVLWTDVSAFRTWDYRVGVQLVAQDGSIHELYTQYMGIGKQNAEHLQIVRSNYTSSRISRIYYTDIKSCAEHLELEEAKKTTIYNGLYEMGIPTLLSVYNIDDGFGDWGHLVVFEFDKELEADSVESSIGSFYFVDEDEKFYFASEIGVDETGRKVILQMVDINNVAGKCIARYEPGVVITMVDEPMAAQEVEFTPVNLVPNDNVLPEVVNMWNLNKEGTEVAIQFTEPLYEIPANSANKFIVTINEPEYAPGGPLSSSIKPVVTVKEYVGLDQSVELESGSLSGIRANDGSLSLEVVVND